jgi:hypothetical protein
MFGLLIGTMKEQELPLKSFPNAQLASPYVSPYLLRFNAIFRCS